MLAKIHSCAVLGIEGHLIQVEVDVAAGLPVFATVGLPDAAVRESRDRVRTALKNSGFEFPQRKITVNLAPADIRKQGAGFDLPIAVALLVATGIINHQQVSHTCVVGELSLDGRLQPVPGILAIIMAAKSQGLQKILIPEGNCEDAALAADQLEIIAVATLNQAVQYLLGQVQLPVLAHWQRQSSSSGVTLPDFNDIRGQRLAKRALEIAAAGNHNVLLHGPPGAGKTMLAKRIPSILPTMSLEEILETARIHGVIGKQSNGLAEPWHRPFRSPHHTVSDAGLIGGGSIPQPGEVSLAHNGVLFLDELPEFRKQVLEVLRQPLEEGEVTISRVQFSLTYPARFLLIAAMNPCPCGYFGDSSNSCRCTEPDIRRYSSRISGPLLDRIDMHVEVAALSYEDLAGISDEECSADIKNRVEACREIQLKRFATIPGIHCNAQMGVAMIDKYCQLQPAAQKLLQAGLQRLSLSARSYHRILKLSRTIADLADQEQIQSSHVAEAIQLRRITRFHEL